MSRFVVLLTAISLLILSTFAGLSYYFYQREARQLTYQRDAYQILVKGASKVRDIWNEAPIHFACGELKKLVDVDPVYFQNNPDYLDCFLSKGKILVRHKGKDFYVLARRNSSNRFLKVVARSLDPRPMIPLYGVYFELYIENEPKSLHLSFILEPNRLEVALPARIYAYGQFKERDDWRFDTLNRSILIDRFMVSYRDIAEWVYLDKLNPLAQKVSFPTSKLEWVKPAIGLSIEQMQAFCAFRGKQLLPAHIYDAASFMPVDLDEARPQKVVRGPYPWSYQRKLQFVGDDFDVQYCQKVYSADCIGNAPFEFFDRRQSSWIGMAQLLGGYMEYLHNPLYPKENVKASSFYFDYQSSFHQLGKRLSWDSQGFGYKNFEWTNEGAPLGEYTKYKIGFRCMRERDGGHDEP